jgi:SAM-dependent methyltransferase
VIALACPLCRRALDIQTGSTTEVGACNGCARRFAQADGVWRMLRPERVALVDAFLADYTQIRLAEGRGSSDPAFYRNLPSCPASHPLAGQWRMHRRTWDSLRARVLPAKPSAAPLRIVDLGAGTGWLSNRLAQLGHEPCAIDLSCDGQDGLGAARHFVGGWLRVQAEFDRLPLADASVDAVIFNASLHYSSDYAATLREALRVLAPGGWLAVLETPVYRHEASGRRMVEERREYFRARFGTASDSVPSRQYLTWAGVTELSVMLGLKWRTVRPWYGIRWALRPWAARIRRRREPSQFPILIGSRA